MYFRFVIFIVIELNEKWEREKKKEIQTQFVLFFFWIMFWKIIKKLIVYFWIILSLSLFFIFEFFILFLNFSFLQDFWAKLQTFISNGNCSFGGFYFSLLGFHFFLFILFFNLHWKKKEKKKQVFFRFKMIESELIKLKFSHFRFCEISKTIEFFFTKIKKNKELKKPASNLQIEQVANSKRT